MQTVSLAHGGSSEGNMQMEQMIINFYNFEEPDCWNTFWPRTLGETENNKVTEGR